jgi:glutaredoxin
MSDNTLIYGKDAWPFTRAAREAFAKEGRQFEYFDVIQEPDHLETMLQYSKGSRKVPVIVEGENVTIGFEGKTWGVWSFGWKPILLVLGIG